MNFENIDHNDLEIFDYNFEQLYVYFLYNSLDELLYVGQTNNLHNRISNHFSDGRILGISTIRVLEVEKDYANDAESYFIVNFKPLYNNNIPQNDIYISLANFKRAARLFKIKESEVDAFVKENNIVPTNGYFRSEALKKIILLRGLS